MLIIFYSYVVIVSVKNMMENGSYVDESLFIQVFVHMRS